MLLVSGWLIGLLAPMASSGASADPAVAIPLGQREREDIRRIESYLNDLTTLKAHFLQASSNGAFAEGEVHLSRPGHMRIDYDPPMPVEIVAEDGWLIYHDKSLKQVTHVDLDDTPAGILINERVSFRKGSRLSVTGFERDESRTRLTIVRTADPAEGSLTLVFTESPFSLERWIVVDAQGISTEVMLRNPQFGVSLSPDIFRFHDPYFFEQRRD